ELIESPLGSLTRDVDYGELSLRHSMAIPWGDVSTAFHSTGIPNIEVYTAVPKAAAFGARAISFMPGLMGSKWLKAKAQARVDAAPAGPTDEQRKRGFSILWGEVENAAGKRVQSRLRTPEGYTITADASLVIAQ